MFQVHSSRRRLLLYSFIFIGLKVLEIYFASRSFFEPFAYGIPFLYRNMGLFFFYVLYYFLLGLFIAGFFDLDLLCEDRLTTNGVFYAGLIVVIILPIFYFASIRFFSFYPKGYNGLQLPILFFSGMATGLLIADRRNRQKKEKSSQG